MVRRGLKLECLWRKGKTVGWEPLRGLPAAEGLPGGWVAGSAGGTWVGRGAVVWSTPGPSCPPWPGWFVLPPGRALIPASCEQRVCPPLAMEGPHMPSQARGRRPASKARKVGVGEAGSLKEEVAIGAVLGDGRQSPPARGNLLECGLCGI